MAMSDVKVRVTAGKCTYSSGMQIKLRRAEQSDNRQVSMPGDMLNFHVEPGDWFASDQRVRQRARSATRPDSPWL